MVSVIHSVAAQSDFEHSLQTLVEGLPAVEAERLRRAVDFARGIYGDGQLGLPEAAPFDAIIMPAAATHIPPALLEQLAVGGRMILPLGTQEQFLWMIDKQEDTVQKTRLDPVRFVPLLNGQQ